MEESKKKFVCKYCHKRFPCGKSLGGHIRTHMMTEERSSNNGGADSDTLLLKIKKKRDLWCSTDSEAVGGNGNSTIYGLRENPKKTMRFVYSNAVAAAAAVTTTLEHEEKFCKECGKGFPSLKALCGHMASHSDKEKRMINKFDFEQEDTSIESDTAETCAPPKHHPRRSKRMRFKSLTNHPSSSLVPLANGSSSVSEVEQEQEEVARWLMLLSQDSSHTHKGRFASESNSDNNSVVLETKPSSLLNTRRIPIRNGNNNFVEKKKKLIKDIKLKSSGIGVPINNSDSRYFRSYGSKIKIVGSSDVSNYEIFNKPKVELEDKSGRFEDSRSKYNVNVVKKFGMKKGLDYDIDRTTEGTTSKFNYRKRSNYDSLGHNLAGNGNKIAANGFTKEDGIYENGGKKDWNFERDSIGSYDDSTEDESNENSSESSDSFAAAPTKFHNNSKGGVNRKKSSSSSSNKAKKKKLKLKSKKSKEHECPICYKIFRSGQALGGHKRSHFIGGSEENTVVIKQAAAPVPSPPVPCLIDLNLPAPVDE